jgi:hypothetical protein
MTENKGQMADGRELMTGESLLICQSVFCPLYSVL